MNPYPQTTAIHDPRQFFGRTRELRKIVECANQGKNLSVVGSRRFGKTSLRNMAMHPGVQEAYRLRSDRLLVAPFFRAYAARDAADFFRTIWKAVTRAAGIEPDRDSRSDTGESVSREQDRLEQALALVSSRGYFTSIVLDEVDSLFLGSGLSAADFGFLRQLADNDSGCCAASFIVFSRNPLHMISRQAEASPFFNVFGNVMFLGNLDASSAEELIRNPSNQAGVPLDAHVAQIIQFAGRQPLILQHACSIAFESVRDARPFDGAELQSRLFVAAEGFLEDWWLTFRSTDKQALRAIASGMPSTCWELEIGRLKQTGWLDVLDGALAVSPPVLGLFAKHTQLHSTPATQTIALAETALKPVAPDALVRCKVAVGQLRTALHHTVSSVLQNYLGDRSPWHLESSNPALFSRLNSVKYFDASDDPLRGMDLNLLVDIVEAGWDLYADYLTPSAHQFIRPLRFWRERVQQIESVCAVLDSGRTPSTGEVADCTGRAHELLGVLNGNFERR